MRTHLAPAAGAGLLWLVTFVCWMAGLQLRAAADLPLGPTSERLGSAVEAIYAVLLVFNFMSVATVGLLVAIRRPGHYFGWLTSVCALIVAVSAVLGGYAEAAIHARGVPPALTDAAVAGWLATWISIANIGLVGPLLVLFPTGRAPSRRWHAVMWFLAAAAGAGAISLALKPGPLPIDTAYPLDNPFGIAGSEALLGAVQQVAFVCLPIGLIAVASSLAVRLGRATGDERQQVKWVAYGAVIWSIGFAAQILSPPGWRPVTGFAYLFTLNAFSAAIAVAILKYHLYAIDLVIHKTLVYGALAVGITVVYVAVVVGLGALVGTRGESSLALSLLVTALVAVAFQPLRERVQRLANRLVYGQRASPYAVLADFSRRMAGALSLDEILPRMAEAAAHGVGAARSRVHVYVPDGQDQLSAWAGEDVKSGTEWTVPVRHQGTLVGEIAVSKPPGEPLTSAERALLEDLAAQAGPALSNVRLAEELRGSRQRLVAAQDAERRRLERDLHDGAQQQLVALAVNVQVAQALVRSEPTEAEALLGEVGDQAREALGTLRDLARGIYPPALADRGLPAALEAHLAKARPSATLEADLSVASARYTPEVEAAVYFCCQEALQNCAKHAGSAPVTVRLAVDDGWLVFTVADAGPGFELTAARHVGSGLQNMADRLAALGGILEVRSQPGEGTTVVGRVPTVAASRWPDQQHLETLGMDQVPRHASLSKPGSGS